MNCDCCQQIKMGFHILLWVGASVYFTTASFLAFGDVGGVIAGLYFVFCANQIAKWILRQA